MVSGQELNAIQALASRNFFSPNMMEGGAVTYSHQDKKMLHIGYFSPTLVYNNLSFYTLNYPMILSLS